MLWRLVELKGLCLWQ